tara:strand:+ start:7888 stop:10386 length:2499 start_codon:yes stop_codon:yes gene_type:complete
LPSKLNITSRFLAILLGLLINNGFSKTQYSNFSKNLFLDSNSVFLSPDTTSKDSSNIDEISDGSPDFPVKYTAKDSINFDNTNQIVYLFGEAKVNYDKISLEADRIKVFISKNEVHAFCKKDSLTGKILQKVIFTDDGDSFEAPEMKYNFNTKKGRIIQATTQEGEMYLLSNVGKKMPNNDIFLTKGKLTTCDHEHPHFYFESRKLKVIPGKKIVVGPTNLVIRELRTPMWLPFGIFPNNQKRKSGILMPGYDVRGESIGLDNLGYHWAINDYVHAEFLSSIYFSGRTILSGELKYKKRYKYNGNIFFRHNKTVSGTPDISGYKITKDFNIRWNFQQDSKVHPKSSFRVFIDYKSPRFNQTQNLNTSNAISSVQGQNASQLKWSWIDKKWSLTTTSTLNQNFSENRATMTLPHLNLSARAIKKGIFSFSGSAETKNKVTTGDSTFFSQQTLQNFKNGARATVIVGLVSNKPSLFKYLKLTLPTVTWNSYLITEEMSKIQSENGLIDTTNKLLNYAYDLSLGNIGLNTRIFGTYKLNDKFYVKGFRHTITPSANFTYQPDFFIDAQKINKNVFDTVTNEYEEYNRYATALYGPNANKAARINFSLDQNLQSKVRDLSDSTGLKNKKIDIINKFSLSSKYDLLKDSLNWSDFRISLSTAPVFLKNLSITGFLSPYAINENGKIYNELLWKNKQLGRLTNFTAQTRLSLNRNMLTKWMFGLEKSPKDNFSWTMDINYTYTYKKPTFDAIINQSLGVTGKVQLTKKTEFNYSLPVNLKTKNFAKEGYLNFTRNLHCWEMKMNWFPFRDRLFCVFTISPKASMLKNIIPPKTFTEKE